MCPIIGVTSNKKRVPNSVCCGVSGKHRCEYQGSSRKPEWDLAGRWCDLVLRGPFWGEK